MKKQWKKANRKITKDIKFELADQDKTVALEGFINKIMKALGHSEALVTDESLISDYLDIFDSKAGIKQLEKAKKIIKVDIAPGDYIWEVAERMKEV